MTKKLTDVSSAGGVVKCALAFPVFSDMLSNLLKCLNGERISAITKMQHFTFRVQSNLVIASSKELTKF